MEFVPKAWYYLGDTVASITPKLSCKRHPINAPAPRGAFLDAIVSGSATLAARVATFALLLESGGGQRRRIDLIRASCSRSSSLSAGIVAQLVDPGSPPSRY
jgi:hypothetical protein